MMICLCRLGCTNEQLLRQCLVLEQTLEGLTVYHMQRLSRAAIDTRKQVMLPSQK